MRVEVEINGVVQVAVLRDGEKVEISRDLPRERGGVIVGERTPLLRVRRISRGAVRVEVLPELEDTPRERVRMMAPVENGR